MAEFSGKKVIIVGGSRGMGAEMVKRFAAMGAETIFTYAKSAEAAEALAAGNGARAVQVDSADRDALVQFIAGEGAIDVLIISAGVFVGGDPLTLDTAEVDRMFDINFRSPYFAVIEAARKMPDGGRIILIGSAAADRVGGADYAPYAMTKSSYKTLARYLAYAWGSREITVNVIQPGHTDTDMNPADGPYGEYMRSQSPIKKHVKPGEIADYAVFLAGPSGAMITGTILNVDGGLGL
jgi:cyclic-di-GMP-binding biofilm dispersal mediator protein